jgi:glyoxylase-like metal-dependent hydrolase (beta-lactamase superfamily II)
MNTLTGGISFIDLHFQGGPRAIASAVLHGPGGVAIVDPGPSTTLPVLRNGLEASGLSMKDVTQLLLTHIHLDHAGATGTLVAENPRLRVYVHEKGAPHLVDPEKLLSSAGRLYGDAMERLWGAVLPVPASAIVTLAGGERIEAGGRAWDVAYTPGHAWHHVSYFSPDAGVAFVGDTAGVRVLPNGPIVPPTPPPDIELDTWRESVARIGRWAPETLFLTHFGPSSPCGPHLAELLEQIEESASLVKGLLASDEDDGARQVRFVEEMRRRLRQRLGEADVHACEMTAPFDLCWLGLARYWRKKNG